MQQFCDQFCVQYRKIFRTYQREYANVSKAYEAEYWIANLRYVNVSESHYAGCCSEALDLAHALGTLL